MKAKLLYFQETEYFSAEKFLRPRPASANWRTGLWDVPDKHKSFAFKLLRDVLYYTQEVSLAIIEFFYRRLSDESVLISVVIKKRDPKVSMHGS